MEYNTYYKMKVTIDNVENFPISEYEKGLLKALLKDLEDINQKSKVELYIDWIDEHTEYSPERTEPCPDYYGMYVIRPVNTPYKSIGVEMDIENLDLTMCVLYNYIVNL